MACARPCLFRLDSVRELVATFLQSDTPEPAKAPVVALVRLRSDLTA